MSHHFWTYEENEYCVEEVFKNFVLTKEREHDYNDLITKLYLYFNGKITKSSIKMKLQNIKYLLNKYNIPNSLTISELENVSKNNLNAFYAVTKYHKIQIQ